MTVTDHRNGRNFRALGEIPQRLLRPVDGSSLAAFRILFGSLLFIAVLRFFFHGWIGQLYIQPKILFTFYGFSWVHPWPGWGMYLHFAALGLLALGIASGFCYRFCTALFFLGFSYVELLDVTNYLNHYYLAGLICFLMIFLPAQRVWSLDAKSGKTGIPLISLWILRGQLALVYFYAGLGKLQPDWLFQAQPLRIWLGTCSGLPLIGPWLQEPWVAYAMSWTGAAYDLSIPLWLIWNRTRPWAFALVVLFHAATAILFPTIGMFPFLMIALTLVFFPPDWPRRLWGKISQGKNPAVVSPPSGDLPIRIRPFRAAALICFFAWQVLWPIRWFAYPGNRLWTEEAYRFSWNVMLMEKAGQTEFFLERPGSGRREIVDLHSWLTPLQQRMMSTQPDLILQTARRIAEIEKQRTGETVAVYADSMVSLNGRAAFPLIDPRVNLAAQSDSFLSKPWILPLP